jgi:hypothetical protein
MPGTDALTRLGISTNLDAFDDLVGVPFATDLRAVAASAFRALDGVEAAAPGPFQPLGGATSTYVLGAGDTDVVDHDDVSQGGLGDCYLMASIGAIARNNPQAIRNMIRENHDPSGNVVSYTVRLHEEKSWLSRLFGGSQFKARDITVDATFPQTRANPGDTGGDGAQELWPMILEKAFAQMKGGYDEIGDGGWPEKALEALTGRNANRHDADDLRFDQVAGALGRGQHVVFDTAGDAKKLAAAYGLVTSHAYTLESVRVDDQGKGWVQLYNPWGYNHPPEIPFDKVRSLFEHITIG